MKKYNNLSFLIILFSLLLFQPNIDNGFAKSYKENKNIKNTLASLNKTAGNPSQSVIDINKITTWVGEEGFHDWVVGGGSWNGAYPNGSNLGAIFSEGIVWGGQVHDGAAPLVRVDGNTYGSGTHAITRLFRVRPDYKTGDLTKDAAAFFNEGLGDVSSSDIQQLRDQYEKDWNEWPADQGAPYDDVNKDGMYEPDIDIPGIPGAAQTIFIKYDDSNSENLYGSPPIGLEVSETYWAYSYSGALGNVIYKMVTFVYTGTSKSAADSKIDSMYIVQWADPDVGASTDDFAGCDTTLNLGYAYSSGTVDPDYSGLGFTPAVGYDFLQGVSKYTGNPNDSAMFNMKWRRGYKYINKKPMSSFIYFAAGGTWSDPEFSYLGTLEFYNLMRGSLPDPPYPTFTKFPESVVDYTPTGTFLVAGDPVTGTGKIDGSVDGPGDRRIMVVNGPISLSLGDTAQVVVALVGGLGTSNLDAITQLKKNDNTAQIVFDQLFQLPSIKPPKVQKTELHNSIVLNWGSDLMSMEKLESFSSQGYKFEGYEVFQLPSSSSSLEDGKLLGIYDLKDGVTAIYDTVADQNGYSIPVLRINGKDNGLTRYMHITTDAFTKKELKDGQSYYFAVVAYAYNPSPLLPFHALISPVNIIQAVPHMPNAGVRYEAAYGDTIKAIHVKGKSDGQVFAIVVDPSKTTGHQYKVTFDSLGSWSVTDVTINKVLVDNQTNQSGDNNYPIIDGLMFKVIGPPLKGVSWSYSGNRWLSGGGFGGSLMWGSVFLGPNFWGETTVSPADLKSVEVDFYKVKAYADTNGNGRYDVGEPYEVDPAKGQVANLYTTWGAGHWEKTALVPFKVFDISSNPPKQLDVIVRDRDGNGQWDPDNGTIRYNYIFVLNTPYDSTGNDWNPTAGGRDFMDEIMQNGGPVLWTFWWVPRGNMEQMSADFSMQFIAPKVNSAADEFDITSPKVDSSATLAKSDLKKINVFPNPYYGYQYRETSRSQHYVTFNHLPKDAIIRIFDLSGVLIKTIKHNPNNGQFERWYLKNENNLPVASGIYIVYIDMPKFGMQKVLKLAIVQEQQILKVY